MVNWASVGLTCSERAISGRAGSVMSTASAVIAAVMPRIAVTIHEVGAGRFIRRGSCGLQCAGFVAWSLSAITAVCCADGAPECLGPGCLIQSDARTKPKRKREAAWPGCVRKTG